VCVPAPPGVFFPETTRLYGRSHKLRTREPDEITPVSSQKCFAKCSTSGSTYRVRALAPVRSQLAARPTPALPSAFAPRTRTRLPCTPALATSNRNSGRARSPRTSPPARAMGRQRPRPSPCPATQGTAPLTSAPHEHPSHVRARRVRRLAIRIASLFP
jgi:hypothetical protein